MNYYILTYFGKSIGESGESCKNKYNLTNACKNCGTQAKLIGNLRTKGIKESPKHLFTTLDGDFIISEILYKDLINSMILINKLSKIIDYRNKELPYYHLKTDLYLPKSYSNNLIVEDQCRICKQNGYFHDTKPGNLENGIPTIVIPVQLVYKKKDPYKLEESDIYNSWEHLGISNLIKEGNKVIRYARPMLIVSEKIKSAFEEYEIKDVKFEKVEINLDKAN